VYSYSMDAVLNLNVHLAGAGHPWRSDVSVAMSPHEVRSLAGECFSAASICSIIGAYWANPFAPWWPKVVEDVDT
jgi:hypothetical protein